MKCKCGADFEPFKRNGIIVSKLCTKCLIEGGKKKQAKEWNKKKKEIKERLKKHSEWLADLQVPINRIARLIDYGQPCIVHPQLKNQNGGHYRSVGSTPNIRFNLHNIHGQSITSNKYKGGEGLLFQEGLRRVYGCEYADYCDSLKVLYPSLNMSIEDIKEALVIARRIVRELEKEPRVYSTDERIELRNKYNKILNIYK